MSWKAVVAVLWVEGYKKTQEVSAGNTVLATWVCGVSIFQEEEGV